MSKFALVYEPKYVRLGTLTPGEWFRFWDKKDVLMCVGDSNEDPTELCSYLAFDKSGWVSLEECDNQAWVMKLKCTGFNDAGELVFVDAD